MKKVTILILTLSLSMGLLFAQEGCSQPKEGRGKKQNSVNEQPYYQYMVFRMTEELKLLPEQAEKLFPLSRPYRDAKHQLHMLMNELSEEVYGKEEITKADLQTYRKTIRDLQEQEFKLDDKYYTDVEKFLEPEQVAKLIFFEPRFRRELSHELKQRYMPENEKKKEKSNFWNKRK